MWVMRVVRCSEQLTVRVGFGSHGDCGLVGKEKYNWKVSAVRKCRVAECGCCFRWSLLFAEESWFEILFMLKSSMVLRAS